MMRQIYQTYQPAIQYTLASNADIIIEVNIEFNYRQLKSNLFLCHYNIMTAINPENIWVLSALDKLMADNKGKPQIFNGLFKKKLTILELLQSTKIDAKKYKAIVAKAYKDDTGEVKKCAQSDLLKCKDGKDDKMVELWFREMVENTGAPYEEQEKQYQSNASKMNTSSKGSNIAANRQSTSQSQNIDVLVSFKAIDSLLEQNEDKKEYFIKLLQRKQKLLALVKSKALTAQKYKSTLELYMSKTTNQDIISDYRFELDGIEDFHDGDVAAWFKETIEETTEKLSDQIKSSNIQKQPPAEISKPIQNNSNINKKESVSIDASKAPKNAFDINAITCFRVLDDQLDKLTNSKENYREVLNKKKKFIQLARNGTLTAEKYRVMLINSIKGAKDQQIKEEMEFQLSQIIDFHDNNCQEWFKDVLSTSEILLEDQVIILEKLEKGEKIEEKQEIDLDNLDEQDEDDVKETAKEQKSIIPQKKPISQEPAQSKKIGKLDINPNTIFSLKALDEFMSEFSKDPETFCICFQRKTTLFDMMKKGELTAAKYKELQEACLKSTTNEKLKEATEMDLFDLKDMCDNDVNQWFESLVNDSGFNYQDQQTIYKQLKGKGPAKSQQKQSFAKPNINELVCFTAVTLLFEYCQKSNDIIYYRELITKRERLLQLLAQKKLIASKYRDINKATAAKTQNQFLKLSIRDQESLLASQYKGKEDEWFSALVNELNKAPPKLKLPQNEEMKKVNGWPIEKKKIYFFTRMAAYESLVRYYNANEISMKNNKYIQQYEMNKKSVVAKTIDQLQKAPELDIYNIVQQLFPPITPNIFYGDGLPELKKKTEKAVEIVSKEIAAIKDYAGKIKKSTNPGNLQDCKKEIAKCEEMIKYLKSWPKDELVGFPKLKEEKIEKYNLDVVRYLEKNEVEVEVTNIDGLSSKRIFKIFVVDPAHARFFAQVHSGPQVGIKTIVKIHPRDMNEIYRGEKKLIIFRIYDKGFFGALNLVGESSIETSFIRNNVLEERIQVGSAIFSYTLRVQKPTKPLITEIIHFDVKPLDVFQVDPKISEELISKYKAK